MISLAKGDCDAAMDRRQDAAGAVGQGVSRRRFLGFLGAVAVLAGCGDNADDTEISASSSSTVSSTASATTDTTSPPTAPQPLELRITFPEDGAVFCGLPFSSAPDYSPRCTIDGPELTFEGIVTPGAEVFVGGLAADVVEDRWSVRVPLDEGEQPVMVQARTADGREVAAAVSVTFHEIEPSGF